VQTPDESFGDWRLLFGPFLDLLQCAVIVLHFADITFAPWHPTAGYLGHSLEFLVGGGSQHGLGPTGGHKKPARRLSPGRRIF
jgi:hypothetical protein